VLPANFIIDSAVVLITLKILKIDSKTIYKKNILKIWGFGFLADFIGTAVMFMPNVIDGLLDNSSSFGDWWYRNMTNAVSYNPFDNIFSILWTTLAVVITAWFIYVFNYKISLKKTEMEIGAKKRLALMLAIFTAPYLFYIPTAWFY
jgi:hypothetical protein